MYTIVHYCTSSPSLSFFDEIHTYTHTHTHKIYVSRVCVTLAIMLLEIAHGPIRAQIIIIIIYKTNRVF